MSKLSHSQNFFKNQSTVTKLVELSSISNKDVVYEVGPGKGIITQELKKLASKVVAIELDDRLFNDLKHKFEGEANVDIVKQDFLEFQLPQTGNYKFFSNIPFNITAAIVKKLLLDKNPPSESYLIIQKEAAMKFSGKPYTSEGLLSLLLKVNFDFEIIQSISKFDFEPTPNVEIVFLKIIKKKSPLVRGNDMSVYRDLLAYVFMQWEPDLKSSLRKIFTNIQFKKLAQSIKFPISVKAGDLTINQWVGVFNYFNSVGVDDSKKGIIFGSMKKIEKQQAGLDKVHRTRE
ncbi:MAG: 23S ribosomal RNA methyltransferase Erm [Chitinophagales bacterium]